MLLPPQRLNLELKFAVCGLQFSGAEKGDVEIPGKHILQKVRLITHFAEFQGVFLKIQNVVK